MENSFAATYKKASGDDGRVAISFEQSRFYPQTVGTAFVLASMLVFLPASCTVGFMLVGPRSTDIPAVQIGLLMSVFIGLFWILFIKTRRAAIIVHPEKGVELSGRTLPFKDIDRIGITTKSNSKKSWAYIFAESGGKEIQITKWMDEAQARAINGEITALSGRS